MKSSLKIAFLILTAVFLVGCKDNIVVPLEQHTPTTPDFTLKVDGKNNCVLLDNSVAARIMLPIGNYNIQTIGNAYIFGNESHRKVLIRYYGLDGKNHPDGITIGNSIDLQLKNWNFYAFFTDWDNINDNGGQLILKFNNSHQLSVDGKVNCILLDNSVAARTNIPAGKYKIKVTGDAYIFGTESHEKVCVRYYGADGVNQPDVLTIGAEYTLQLKNWNFYAFFTDWDNINDNGGQVTLEFYKQ